MIKRIFLCLAILAILIPAQSVSAQQSSPVYIVQPGDTVTVIAFRFGVAVQDLIDANGITDPDSVAAGTPLVIPGLEGVEGTLTTQIVPLGETLSSLSRRYHLPIDQLIRLNRITSPSEIYAGASVIIPQQEENTGDNGIASLKEGESPLELAARQNVNPWALTSSNSIVSQWEVLPGEILFYNNPDASDQFSPISPILTDLEVDPLPIEQGGTSVVRVSTKEPVQLAGSLNGKDLHFFQESEGQYVAIQGIHAMSEPGLTPFSIEGTGQDGAKFSFQQSVLLKPGYYGQDPMLTVDPETIDPANTGPEDKIVKDTITPVTPEKYWSGIFRQPVDDPACIKSYFGNRRAYNGGDYTYFHTGVDYGVCANLNIYAPAAGVIVFSGPLTVRGNATIIDHGWGVYSGIWHQSSTAVKVGDHVEAGQLIGEIGGTGRVTGPHLHWEVWVGGVQVQPLDWLEQEYP